MFRSRSAWVGLVVLVLLASALTRTAALPSAQGVAQGAARPSPTLSLSEGEANASALPPQADPGPTVTARAASGATVAYMTQNGRGMGDVLPQRSDVPHLMLYRNGTLTAPDERTLILELAGLEIPPAGVTVTLRVETQGGDPDLGDRSERRIPVWRESQWIAASTGSPQAGGSALLKLEFDETVWSGTRAVATPTGYFRYDVTVTDASRTVRGAGRPSADPLYAFSQDYAFLMESQWVAPLPEVREASPGAAPDELIVYYCDMFPFQRSLDDPATRLPRVEVTDYVGTELVPRMVEAYRTQSDEWGFPWYDEWTSYRPEEPERLTVALVDGQTWFHGRAPTRGHSGISIRVTEGDNAAYDTLTDGLMANFHHELFHNLQRNIHLHSGGSGVVDGGEDAWQFYSEGTAVLASAVGQPRGQFSQSLRANSSVGNYMGYANNFVALSGGGGSPDLNTSYGKIYPYRAAIYWRFLYEQCGGMVDGAKDQAAGMGVIRRALTALYSGDIVDIDSSTDLVGTLPEVMDRALAGSSCPFQTYSESLTAFARALYGLRMEGGRCAEPGRPAGCGFYDPNGQYQVPSVREVAFAGESQALQDEIGSSFGIDLIDVLLDPAVDGQPLALEFRAAPGSEAEFSVQLVGLVDSIEGARPQRVPGEDRAWEFQARTRAGGRLSCVIPAARAANRLGLIVTRLDTQEASDPVGEYTILLHPGNRGGNDAPMVTFTGEATNAPW
jgi:hypothetical protein